MTWLSHLVFSRIGHINLKVPVSTQEYKKGGSELSRKPDEMLRSNPVD